MDKQTIFELARKTFAALTGRRRVAVVILLLVVGAGIADPSFLGDVGVATDASVQQPSDFAELEAVLSTFDEEQSAGPDDSEGVESDPAAESSDAVENLTQNDAVPLTIPQQQADSAGVRVQGVSHSGNSSSVPSTEPLIDPRATGHRRAALPTGSVAESPVRIRLTGTIFPIH